MSANSTDLINYKVKDFKTFLHETGSDFKSIDKICEKAREFKFSFEEKQFEISLILNNPAIINKVEYKLKNVKRVTFSFLNNGDVLFEKVIEFKE